SPGSGTPTGTVTFDDNGTPFADGTVTLSSGVATFTTSTLSVASHLITAVYNSDGTFDTSTSSAVSQTVAAHAAATHFTVTGATDETAGGTETVIVTALDAYGNTDTGYAGSVAITSSDGHAVLPADSSLTSGIGTFSITLKTAGAQSVTVADTENPDHSGTESGITVTPAAATHLAVAGAPGGTAGTDETLTVTAEDPYGNTDPSYTGTVHFSSSDDQAVLPADSTLTSGVGSFTVTLETAGTQSVTVTDTATSGITGTESDIAIRPGAASQFAVTGIAGGIAGLNQTFTVEARDFFGNVATGYTGTVHFTSSNPRAQLPANAKLTNGVGTFSVTLETVGRQSVTATDTTAGGPSGSESGIPVTVAPVSTYVFTDLRGGVTAGVQQSVTISATDPYSNAEPTYSGTVLLTSSDAQAVLPASLSLTGGTGSFLVTFKTSGAQSITGTDSVHNLVTSTESNILVSAAAATHLVVAGLSGGGAGTAGTLTVTAEDPYGNTATGYTGTVHFTSSDPIAVLPANTTLTNGVGTFNVTLKTAGTESVTVTDTATTTITGAETGIVVTPLATSQFSVTGASGGVAGTVESVTVTAEDAYGNRTTGYAGTVRFTSSDPRASLPANSTLTLGTGTFSVTLVKSGSQSITVTDTVASSLTGSETGIAIAAGDAAQFLLTGLAPHVAGVTQHHTVKAEDFYGNVATSYPGTIHFTSSDPNAILPPDSTLTNGVGTFNVILNTIGTQSVTVSDNTVDGPTGSETGILVTLGPVSQFAVTGLTPDPAGTSQSMIVKAEDAGGNLITGYSGTVHFTSSDSQAVLPADSTLTNGVGSFTVTLKTAGTQSVTA